MSASATAAPVTYGIAAAAPESINLNTHRVVPAAGSMISGVRPSAAGIEASPAAGDDDQILHSPSTL